MSTNVTLEALGSPVFEYEELFKIAQAAASFSAEIDEPNTLHDIANPEQIKIVAESFLENLHLGLSTVANWLRDPKVILQIQGEANPIRVDSLMKPDGTFRYVGGMCILASGLCTPVEGDYRGMAIHVEPGDNADEKHSKLVDISTKWEWAGIFGTGPTGISVPDEWLQSGFKISDIVI